MNGVRLRAGRKPGVALKSDLLWGRRFYKRPPGPRPSPASCHPLATKFAHSIIALLGLAFASSASAQFFAATGDIGNTTNSTAVANFIKGKNPDFMLALGDLCYNSSPSIATQMGKYSSLITANKFWPTTGNHDVSDKCGGTSGSAYYSYFTLPGNERYYDFVLGNVHFFAVNSQGNHEPDGITAISKQALWLKGKLAASTSAWNIVYFHKAAFSSGEHGSYATMQWPFETWGADAVLTGHDHDYERILKGSIPYIVSGLGGESNRPFKTPIAGSVKRYTGAYGALFVTATATSLKFEFRGVSGTVIDTYTMTHAAAKGRAALDFRVCC